MDFVKEDGLFKVTPELKLKRFVSRYPEIFRSKKFDLAKYKKVYNEISEVRDFQAIIYDNDVMNYVLMALLMRFGKYSDVLIINAYTLLDIYLGKNDDWKSIEDIENKIVCVYLGYSEFENRRQSDIIEQLIEQQRVRGNKLWLLYKGRDIKEKYPKIIPLIESLEGLVIWLKQDTVRDVGEEF